MQIRSDLQYYYTRNHERQGPVRGAALEQLAREGQLNATDLVWCAGMPQWIPASNVDGLFGPPSLMAAVPAAPSRAAFPRAPLHGASFGAMVGLMVGGMVGIVPGVILIASADYGNDGQKIAGGVVIGLSVLVLLAGGITGLVYLYRAWAGIQGLPNVSATPARAVGFLFIPLFALYWVFIAYSQWAKDYTAFVTTNRLPGAPPVSQGLFTACSVLMLLGAIPFINYLAMIPEMIVALMCFAQMCRAINYLKAQSESVPAP